MQRNKYFIFLLSGVGIVVILTVLIFLLFKPTQTEETLETEAVESESIDKSETEVSQSESTGKTETEINQSESTGKTETEVHGSGQTAKKTPDTKDTEPEQPQYIGRIVEGYIEPQIDESWAQYDKYLVSLKDTYQSNIQIILEDLNTTDIDAYKWYKYTPEPAEAYYKINQFVCYAILTYYDGKIPCDYYVILDDDLHNYNPDISTMIFEVQTRGEKPLNICLDMYNYKIRVEEGIKKQD